MKKTYNKIIFITAFLVLSYNAKSQILHPVKWSYGAKRINKTEAFIFIKADIDEGWHIYSQTIKQGGPVGTNFIFYSSPSYTLVSTTFEPKPIDKFERVFNMKVSYFISTVTFRQKIKLKKNSAVVKGSLKYMTCNDTKCLPPEEVDFSIPIK
jgi:hypothetical protein